MRYACLILSLTCGLLWTTSALVADSQTPPAPKPSKPNDKMPAFTPEREAAALTFLAAQHPELADVVHQLKRNKPDDYESAIRELFVTSERLARVKEQDPRRYPLELDGWKTKSRIQILSARAALADDPSLEAPLREAIEKQADLRIAQLELQRTQMAEKLAKADAELAKAKENRDQDVEKQFRSHKNSIEKSRLKATKADALNKNDKASKGEANDAREAIKNRK